MTTKNFTATNTPITNTNPGQTVRLEAAVAAADAASIGTWHVMLRLYRVSNNQQIVELPVYSQALTEQPRTVWRNYTLPANLALGQYKAQVTVHAGNWAWQTTTQTAALFDVVDVAAAPPPSPPPPPPPDPVPASLVKISGDDQGGTVNQAQPAPMVVQALNADGSPFVGATVVWAADAGSLSEASTVSDAEGKAAVTLTHPAIAGKTTVTASVGDLSATFMQTCRMVLYGTHSPRLTLLKPAGSGDPLLGTGFLPDDGRAYTLIDGDEFDGSSLDTEKWWRRYRDNNGTLAYFNDELQRYVDNHVVADGLLKLTARVKPGTEGHAPANGNTYPSFDSSMIRSRTTFKHGYVEARMKLPNGLGVWPAFWILADGNRPCEIDIVEFVLNGVNEFADMIHGGNVHSILDSGTRWRDDKYNPQYSYWRAWGMSQPTYFVDDWHVFGLLWESDQIIYYINGQPVVQRKITWTNGGVDGGLASVIFNLAMGGSWPTNGWTTPVATDDQVLAVDYVRVFQRSDSINTGISQV